MNIENIDKVIAQLEQLKIAESSPILGWNMDAIVSSNKLDTSGHMCNSVGCIAGHAKWIAMLEQGVEPKSIVQRMITQDLYIDEDARIWLGLEDHIANVLFYPNVDTDVRDNGGCDYEKITLDQAVQALNNLKKHGDPRWIKILTPDQYLNYCCVEQGD